MKKPFMALAAIVLCVMASANDLTLRYDRPAQFFEEALVIGNGNIGATVYGGINRERISLNDITLWTGEPETGVTTPGASSRIPEIRRAIDRVDFRAADSLNMFVQGHYSENYQPLGTLNITFNGIDSAAVTGYNRSLSLNDAVARSTFTIGNLRRTTSAFVSASDSKTLYRPSRIQPRPRRAIFPIRALPAHFKQPHPGSTRQPAGVVERASPPALEQQLHHQHKR